MVAIKRTGFLQKLTVYLLELSADVSLFGLLFLLFLILVKLYLPVFESQLRSTDLMIIFLISIFLLYILSTRSS